MCKILGDGDFRLCRRDFPMKRGSERGLTLSDFIVDVSCSDVPPRRLFDQFVR